MTLHQQAAAVLIDLSFGRDVIADALALATSVMELTTDVPVEVMPA